MQINMAQRWFSCLIIFSLFFFSCPILSSSIRTSKINSRQAEKLIHTLNLFPRLPNETLSSLVEKRFCLQFMCGSRTPIHNLSHHLGHHAGYYRLPHSKDARMFYFFFESRKNKRSDPVVIWLNGGPGCSSSIGLFYENGPYKITSKNSLIWNDFGWDKVSNMIYVDQPIGTGFSYSSDVSDIPNDQESVINDLYDFLQAFYEKHPQYLKNDFYITGESYAGHYIPALASRIHNANKNNDGVPINLKGFAIGNALIDPAIQFKILPYYALTHNLIKEVEARHVAQLIPRCERHSIECNARIGGDGESCLDAYSSCTAIFQRLLKYFGSKRSYYDTRKKCVGDHCIDFSYMETLLNNASVRNALGVGDIQFLFYNKIVFYALLKNWARNYAVLIPSLLEDGIKVLIYAGEYDLICNWLGNYMWVSEMKWSGEKQYNEASMVSYKVDGVLKGKLKEYRSLSFLKVLNAGHMVPMDQPKVALKMLERWTKGTLSMS